MVLGVQVAAEPMAVALPPFPQGCLLCLRQSPSWISWGSLMVTVLMGVGHQGIH